MQLRTGKQAPKVLKNATIRDFSGGLNTLDDDLNLSTKFSTKLDNCFYSADGKITVRYGKRHFINVNNFTTVPGNALINGEYFQAALILVCSNGEILATYGDGATTRIWDSAIASAQPDSPSGWSDTEFCSFAQFNGELVICNGVDKPLIVRSDLTVEYLHDEATGSNLNTPIGRYVCTSNRYLIIAGDPLEPNRIHISARDTSGTFYGDPLPNDGTFVDVGSGLRNSSYIRGIADFRGKLIVGFAEGSIIGNTGIYNADGDVHLPEFNDNVEQHGTVSHRCMLSYGDDMLMLDLIGVSSLKRTVFTGTLRPERISDLINNDIIPKTTPLSFGTLEDRVFGIYDQRQNAFLFFIPNDDVIADTTETDGFQFAYRPNLNVNAWSTISGWNLSCAIRSLQGNIFLGDREGNLYVYGNEQDPVYKDFLDDPNVNAGEGSGIDFDWELPWSDVNNRRESKLLKYCAFDTRGYGEFSVSIYTDEFMLDGDGNDAPLLTTIMTGGSNQGFGSGVQSYGTGRTASDQHLLAFPAKFQLIKFRFRGTVEDELGFIGISIFYQTGSIFR